MYVCLFQIAIIIQTMCLQVKFFLHFGNLRFAIFCTYIRMLYTMPLNTYISTGSSHHGNNIPLDSWSASTPALCGIGTGKGQNLIICHNNVNHSNNNNHKTGWSNNRTLLWLQIHRKVNTTKPEKRVCVCVTNG